MRVYIYYNLHRHVWSIKALEGEHKGRVVGHTAGLRLRDVECRVSEAGRQRVLRERRKNVHAGLVGELWAVSDRALAAKLGVAPLFGGQDTSGHEQVSYNPYRFPRFFVVGEGSAVDGADAALMLGRSVFALGLQTRPMHDAAQLDMFAAA